MKQYVSDTFYIDQGKYSRLKVDCNWVREGISRDDMGYVKGSLEILDISVQHGTEWYSIKWLIDYYNLIDNIKDKVIDELY